MNVSDGLLFRNKHKQLQASYLQKKMFETWNVKRNHTKHFMIQKMRNILLKSNFYKKQSKNKQTKNNRCLCWNRTKFIHFTATISLNNYKSMFHIIETIIFNRFYFYLKINNQNKVKKKYTKNKQKHYLWAKQNTKKSNDKNKCIFFIF